LHDSSAAVCLACACARPTPKNPTLLTPTHPAATHPAVSLSRSHPKTHSGKSPNPLLLAPLQLENKQFENIREPGRADSREDGVEERERETGKARAEALINLLPPKGNHKGQAGTGPQQPVATAKVTPTTLPTFAQRAALPAPAGPAKQTPAAEGSASSLSRAETTVTLIRREETTQPRQLSLEAQWQR
jgi:hypothetical protein